MSASISDTSIQNLADPVVITLQHIEGNQVTHPFSSQNKKASEPLHDFPNKNNWLVNRCDLKLHKDYSISGS